MAIDRGSKVGDESRTASVGSAGRWYKQLKSVGRHFIDKKRNPSTRLVSTLRQVQSKQAQPALAYRLDHYAVSL